MPFIGTTPTQGFVSSFPKQSFTPNGSTTVFTLTNPVATANDLEVFVGNVRQEPTTAYTAAGTTLTMSEAPASGLNFYVINKSFAQVTTTPPVNSISTDKIVNSAVTDAKIGGMTSSKLTGAMPALNGSSLTHTGGLKSVQVFATAGTHTYTKPAGIRTVKVTVTGGGGSGGGYGAANDFGSGGGAGGTVNVGTANGNGGAGSSFGSHATGNGGDGGRHGNIGSTYGGDGGTATGGDINIQGGDGNNGIDNMYNGGGTDYRPSYGMGGASFWGGGGRPGVYNIPAGTGNAIGSGGGGGSAANSGGGEAGKLGIVYVEEFA